MKVYVCIGEHWEVPGTRLTVHATEAGANTEAASLVNIMIGDTDEGDKPDAVNASNWQPALEWLLGIHGAQYCYVDIWEREIEGIGA